MAPSDDELFSRQFFQMPADATPSDMLMLLGRVLERADTGARAVERIERRIDGAVDKIELRFEKVDEALIAQDRNSAARDATLAYHTKQLKALGGVIAVQRAIDAAPKIGVALGAGGAVFTAVVWIYGYWNKITGKQ